MGATSGTGTAYTYRAHEFTPVFLLGSCCSIFSFLCSIMLTIVILAFVLSVLLLIMASDYHFGIFKLFIIIYIKPLETTAPSYFTLFWIIEVNDKHITLNLLNKT
jgi:hypothetical protein